MYTLSTHVLDIQEKKHKALILALSLIYPIGYFVG